MLEKAKLEATAIDKVIMCGGTSKIPKLQRVIGGMFGKAELLTSINPDEVIAVGAANHAALLPEGEVDKTEAALNEKGSFDLQATAMEIAYVTTFDKTEPAADPETTVLVPVQCPIPVRRSHHLTLPTDLQNAEVKVTFFLKSPSSSTVKLAEVIFHKITFDIFFREKVVFLKISIYFVFLAPSISRIFSGASFFSHFSCSYHCPTLKKILNCR